MRVRIIIPALLALFSVAGVAQAGPQIIFYSYTPPPPQLQLTSISPANHQAFSGSQPASVELAFSLAIDPMNSSLQVYDQYNNTVVVSGMIIKDTHMSLQLPPHLLSEPYRVEWKATCTCQGNPSISGTSYFTVN